MGTRDSSPTKTFGCDFCRGVDGGWDSGKYSLCTPGEFCAFQGAGGCGYGCYACPNPFPDGGCN
jgi:hypothetical protein